MKLILILFFMLTANGCQNTDVTEISYIASTRGYYYKAVISPKKVLIYNNNNETDVKEREITPNDWKNLIKYLENIEVASISELQRPSKDSYFDGAASAHITVGTSKKVYTSSPFDQGNPPKEINSFVKAIHKLCDALE